MNVELHDLMADRADSVEPPQLDPMAVVAHGERLVRRRNRLTVAGAVLALVVTAGTAAVVVGEDRDVPRPDPAGPIEPPRDGRPLTYGVGQVLHLGDREVHTGQDFLTLDVTDDGAAFTTFDGGIWFTDGHRIDPIGQTLGGTARAGGISYPAGRPREWVVNDAAGSLLAWLEFPGGAQGRPELVVYDTAEREVLGRTAVTSSTREPALVAAVVGRQVFVSRGYVGYDFLPVQRYDVDTGELVEVVAGSLREAREAASPSLVVGESVAGGTLIRGDADSDRVGDTPRQVPVAGGRLGPLVYPGTDDLLDVRVPPGYESTESFWFSQWLDEDHFVVLTDVEGDLLVCRISAGRCSVAVVDGSWGRRPHP